MEESQKSHKVILEERQAELKQALARRIRVSRLALIMGIICTFLIPIVFYFMINSQLMHVNEDFFPIVISVSLLYGVAFILVPVMRPQSEFITELQEIQNELDLLSISDSSIEERSEKLFKHHHFELKRYYDENLKQSSWLFIVGIICIFIGFIVIGITMYFLLTDTSKEVTSKIIIASLGAIGGILSNFIAVIYLKMHSETVKSLTEFHNRFVNTHHFYFGNFLISKIQDQAKREDALTELALSINGSSPTQLALNTNGNSPAQLTLNISGNPPIPTKNEVNKR